MHAKNIKSAGRSIQQAEKVAIMVHGRGGNAPDILGLASELNVSEYALIAPQATNHTWYPYSFMVAPEQNEPWLTSALERLKEVVEDVMAQGISSENIYLVGFSQGACLILEFAARNAKKYGGIVAFTGGLIGDIINSDNYSGNFNETPIFIGTGNPDPHIPVQRVEESRRILEEMNAEVNVKVYDGRPHTISRDEIETANRLIFK